MIMQVFLLALLTCGSMASPQMGMAPASMGMGMGMQQSGRQPFPQPVQTAQTQQCDPISQTSVDHVCKETCDCLCNGVRGSIWMDLCYVPCVELAVSNRAMCFVAQTIGDPKLTPFSNCPPGLTADQVCRKSCACCGLDQSCVESCKHGLLAYLNVGQCQRAHALISGGK